MWFSQWAVATPFGRLHVLWPMVETSVLWLMPLLAPTLYLMAMWLLGRRSEFRWLNLLAFTYGY
jgi:hypothetical protein